MTAPSSGANTWSIPLEINNLESLIYSNPSGAVLSITAGNPNVTITGTSTNPIISGTLVNLTSNVATQNFALSGNTAGNPSFVIGGGEEFKVITTDLTPHILVSGAVGGGVQLGNPAGYGGYKVTAPTVANSSTNDTQVATTAFVQSAISSGTSDVNSITSNVSGFTFSPSTGNVVMSGTLAVANGGTGVTTATGYLYGNGTSAVTSSTTIPTTALSGTITNAQLANSTISGVALGGNLANLTIGSGLTGTSSTYNGSTADTVSIPASGVTAGSYNTANITVNSQGIITSASTGAGGVTSFSAGTTGLTPNTATGGAITLGGTLAVANGGTGVTTSTGTGSVVLSANPTLTGVPTAPTATTGTSTTQLATTAFVANALGSTTAFVPPAVTTYTSGSGTYTVPANALYLTVQMVGGGGGGGGSGGGNLPLQGGSGGTTTFGTSLLTCNGGVGGQYGQPSVLGGTSTISAPAVGTTIQGGASGSGSTNISGFIGGQAGGTSFFGGGGGGGNNSAGTSASANTGAGGGSAGTDSVGGHNTGSGGSAGGFITAIIPNPLSASYSYAVGAGGAGGSAGTSGYAGGAGGSGVIIITAYFSAITQTLSQINQSVTAQTGNSTFYPVFVSGDTTGSYGSQVDGAGKLNYNPSSGILTATKFVPSITTYGSINLPYVSIVSPSNANYDLQSGGLGIPNAGVWKITLQTRLRCNSTSGTYSGFIALGLASTAISAGSTGNPTATELLQGSNSKRTMGMENILSCNNSFINVWNTSVWLVNVGTAQTFPYNIFPFVAFQSVTGFVNYADLNGIPCMFAERIAEPSTTGVALL